MSYTYRQLFTKHLPEPYRSQAIANAVAQDRDVDDPSDTAGIDPEDLYDVVACSFTWKYSPEGHDYWQRASGGEFEVSELRLEAEPAAHRLLEVGEIIQQGDEVEELDGWRQVSAFPITCNIPGVFRRALAPAATPPTVDARLADLESRVQVLEAGSPGAVAAPPTYRLLNPGEVIREGDELLEGINLDGPEEWRAVITSKGSAFDPDDHLPTRRQIKSYEDA